MMLQKITYTFFTLLFILLIVGCNSDKKNLPSKDDFPEIQDSSPTQYNFILDAIKDTAKYSQQLVYKSESEDEDQAQQTKISISFPHIDSFSNKAVKDSVNAVIRDMLLLDASGSIAFNSIEDRLDDFILEYETARREMEKELVFQSKWLYDIDIDVMLNTSRILTLRYYEMSFTGGIHPNTFTRYLNFDMQSGEIIDLQDFLVEGFQEELIRVSEQYFRSAMNIPQDQPITETRFVFRDGQFMLSQNYALLRTGIRFCYNPLDIGPYALGTTEFEVPYDAIVQILRKDALVAPEGE